MSAEKRILAFVLLLAAACCGQSLKRLQEVVRETRVAAHAVVDVDGDGRSELVVFDRDGDVRTYAHAKGGATPLGAKALGSLKLQHPERTVFAFGDVLGRKGSQLVQLSPAGGMAFPAEGSTLSAKGVRLARRMRFGIRTNQPTRGPILDDTDGDGRPDVMLPLYHHCELWLNRGAGEGGAPTFRKTARIAVNSASDVATHQGRLSDVMHQAVRVPRLRIRDVNGDGRRDLYVSDGGKRSFHLQAADGTLPTEPTVSVAMEIFRDTTPSSKLKPGRTLAGGDRAVFRARDLDGDGIEDHVIAHRRKVWVFHGTEDGPQFTDPSTILKTSDDVTLLLLLRVDDDPLPDLVLVKVQVPSVGALLGAFFGSWEVEIGVSGYKNTGDRRFAKSPAWKKDLVVKLPSLSGILKNPDALIRRFEDAGNKFRDELVGDFDGDGNEDIALHDADGRRIDVWIGASGDRENDYEGVLRDLLFGDDDGKWDIDRILHWLENIAERRAARVTGGRKADASFTLREDLDAQDPEVGDLDGDGRVELVVPYVGVRRTVFDVVGLR